MYSLKESNYSWLTGCFRTSFISNLSSSLKWRYPYFDFELLLWRWWVKNLKLHDNSSLNKNLYPQLLRHTHEVQFLTPKGYLICCSGVALKGFSFQKKVPSKTCLLSVFFMLHQDPKDMKFCPTVYFMRWLWWQ